MTLRVLIVDDSAYNRQIISETLETHPDIKVVGRADDGEQGLKLAASLKPDLITLDIEMPRMDGFTFLRLLMSRMPTPVIVISSHSRKQEVFQALELGALDFVAKPDRYLPAEGERLREEILGKVLAVNALQVVPFKNRTQGAEGDEGRFSSSTPPKTVKPLDERNLRGLVAIGASTGGPPALQTIFKTLPLSDDVALVVTQHMPEKFTRAFAERLNRISAYNIMEAADGMTIVPGHVYVAPGAHHLEVVRAEKDTLATKLSAVSERDRYIPSADRLFESVARLSGLTRVGIVLTGMGADGAEGVRAIHGAGGTCIAESQDSAIVFGMPKEAIRTRCVHQVLSLDQILEYLIGFVGGYQPQ